MPSLPPTAAPRTFPARRMGLDNLWKPDLRGRIEAGIARVAAGQMNKDQVSLAANFTGRNRWNKHTLLGTTSDTSKTRNLSQPHEGN